MAVVQCYCVTLGSDPAQALAPACLRTPDGLQPCLNLCEATPEKLLSSSCWSASNHRMRMSLSVSVSRPPPSPSWRPPSHSCHSGMCQTRALCPHPSLSVPSPPRRSETQTRTAEHPGGATGRATAATAAAAGTPISTALLQPGLTQQQQKLTPRPQPTLSTTCHSCNIDALVSHHGSGGSGGGTRIQQCAPAGIGTAAPAPAVKRSQPRRTAQQCPGEKRWLRVPLVPNPTPLLPSQLQLARCVTSVCEAIRPYLHT